VRPIGNKKGKQQALYDTKLKRLKSEFAKATETMVAANLKKVKVVKETTNL